MVSSSRGCFLYYRLKGWIMFNPKIAAFAAFTAMALSAGVASATVIDFTDANTGTSGTLFGSVNWTMTASGNLNNSQAYDGGLPLPPVAALDFERDGYGVGDDEITGGLEKGEWIRVSFDTPTLIDAIYFLDLFVNRATGEQEIAQAQTNTGAAFTLFATDLARTGSGFVGLSFAPTLVSWIEFRIDALNNDGLGKPDGALAGIGIAPIPVPAAGLLLLGGLGGLAVVRRRRRAV